MKLDQLLLGQIPEAIYFALFMILVKTYPNETVGDFAERCRVGTYLVTMPNHITTVIDGIVYDTFDCRDRELWDVWKVL